MTQAAKFEVEDISSITGRGFLVLARRLDDEDFWINQSTRLDGALISYGDIPRKLDEHGNQRRDIWGFILAEDDDSKRFYPGKVVELLSKPPS